MVRLGRTLGGCRIVNTRWKEGEGGRCRIIVGGMAVGTAHGIGLWDEIEREDTLSSGWSRSLLYFSFYLTLFSLYTIS
jgi:hypothetical protein